MIFRAEFGVADEDILLGGFEERGIIYSNSKAVFLDDFGQEFETATPDRPANGIRVTFTVENKPIEEVATAFEEIMELEGSGGSLELLTGESGETLDNPKFLTEI